MNDTKTKLEYLYLDRFGNKPSQIIQLQGDGSERKIFRLLYEGQSPVIGVCGTNINENTAFIEFSKHFSKKKLPVPFIYAYKPEFRIYLLSDLGNTTLYNIVIDSDKKASKDIMPLYKQVVSLLPIFQIKAGRTVDYSFCYQYSSFENDSMQFDINYFARSFLKRFVKLDFDSERLNDDFKTLKLRLLKERVQYFMYRDFQSKNIMINNDKPFFIDYQSGRKGALQYDLASLLYDANFELVNDFREELLEFYLAKAQNYIDLDANIFMSYYYDFVLIRMLQALAAFSSLAYDKGKLYFLKNIPNALNNIIDLLSRNCILRDLTELRKIFEDDILQNDFLKNL